MQTNDVPDREISEDQRRWLLGELHEWQSRAILTEVQAEQIRSIYRAPERAAERARRQTVFTLWGMAAFLLGLAVMLLVGFNWEAMPRWSKLGVVLAGVAAVHAVGFYLRFGRGWVTAAEVVFFFGCLLYGAGIWLIAQAYHLNAHYPDGVWWWAVGVLPFALISTSLLTHLLYVGLLVVWVGMEVLGGSAGGAYTLPLLALPGLLWAYRGQAASEDWPRQPSLVGVGLYVPVLVWWAVLQTVTWGVEDDMAFWIGAAGAGLLVVASLHRAGDPMAGPYYFWGTLLSAGALVPLSSSEFWSDVLDRQETAGVATAVGIPILLGGLLVVGGIRGGWRRVGYPAALAVCVSLLAVGHAVLPPTFDGRLGPLVLANVAMLALAVYLIRGGARRERLRPFAAGVGYFLIWAFARYFDLFDEESGMLEAAGLFALSAIALVVVARFWVTTGAADRGEDDTLEATAAALTGPAWFDRGVRWAASWGSVFIVLAAVLHLAVLGGMVAIEAVPLMLGRTVRLPVEPVDPRAPFRGDYVTLDYGFNRFSVDGELRNGQTVYAKLAADAEGPLWHLTGVTRKRPEEGTFLQGRYDGQRFRFGIEAYYVQEGTGAMWERLRDAEQLSAEIAVTSWGQAKLVRLHRR